jgi:serine/threonine-protein kinase
MDTDSMQNSLLGNRYRLIHQIGRGGMAYVFKAYDQLLERPVAVKLLKKDFSEDENFRERFKKEATAAANLSHPNIVTVHDFGIDSSGVYLVMEYVPGTDLKTKIKEKGLFSVEEGLPLMIQACAGLGYAHRSGIVHCDVKPHNMLVTSDQRLKITDFGIARALSSLEEEGEKEIVWGSPQYFAPEQAIGENPTPAADVYSLGVVIYELFTGHLPFEAETVEKMIEYHRTRPPTDPRVYVPDLPEDLTQIILKVLSKEPASRYRTADQLGHVLSRINEQKTEPIKGNLGQITTENIQPPVTQPVRVPPPITPEDNLLPVRLGIDWKLIGLQLLTLLMVGGLVPFWLFVFLKLSAGTR